MRERHHLEQLLENGNVEIRCLDKTSPTFHNQKGGRQGNAVVWSSVFDNIGDMTKQIRYAASQGWDVYNTINPVKIPATNGNLKPFARTTKDTDITSIKTIFFDFDPSRETGTSATDEQIQLSVVQAEALADFLTEDGWQLPLIGFSGNGCHLMYRTSMGTEHKPKMKGFYTGLAKRFTTDDVDFDVTVKNAARIARTYGTVNNKSGTRSSCVSSEETTSEDTILKTITKVSPPKLKAVWVKPLNETEAGSYIKNWDVVGAFTRAGLYVSPTQDIGMHIVKCPWESEHTSIGAGEVAIWEGEWPQYNCMHAHCANRTIQDVIAVLGGAS